MAAVAPGTASCHGHGPCLVRLATHGTGTLQGRPGRGGDVAKRCYWERIFVREILETNDDYVWNANHQHMDLFDFTFLDTDVTRRDIGNSLI